MNIIVIFCDLILIFLAFCIISARNNFSICWRNYFISTLVTCGILVIIITELLSLFNQITFGWISAIWWTIFFVLFLVLFYFFYKTKLPIYPEVKFTSDEILLLSCLVFIILTTGLTAFVAPPNSYDSMTYHLSRVVHWMRNHNVKPYPTNIERQISRTPGAEFIILHLQILSGGDRFANFVQWFSMLGSVIGVSLIAKQLGANKKGQILASLVAATIPMGILQASSTQNDYVVSLWLASFVYYLMRLMHGQYKIYSFAAGAALGLAMLTKASAYTYSFPFLVWYGISGIKNFRKKLWKSMFIMFSVALVINLGFFMRNINLYGTPLAQIRYESNRIFTISSLVSNIIRQASLHIGVPIGFINEFNIKGIKLIHTFLGIDINGPRTTYVGTNFDICFSLDEGGSGNLIHFILFILCSVIFFMKKQQRNERTIANYIFALTATFLLSCFFTKWTPWQSRLHLPLFVLCSPFVGIMLSKITKNIFKGSFIAFILILSSLPWIFYNFPRRLIGARNIFSVGRLEQYFAYKPYLKNPYMDAANYIKAKGYSSVGLCLGGDDWEYPFWVLLKNNSKITRIEHVNVNNPTAQKYCSIPFNSFIPEVIISIDSTEKKVIVQDNISEQKFVFEYR